MAANQLLWSAVTCHRFPRRDLSRPFLGDHKPGGAEPPRNQSGDRSPHSKVIHRTHCRVLSDIDFLLNLT